MLTALGDDVARARHQLRQVVLGSLEGALQSRERVGRGKAERVREPLRVPRVLEDDHRHRAQGPLYPGLAHGGGGGDNVDLGARRLVLCGRESRFELFVKDFVGSVDGDEAGHLIGIRTRVEPTQQTAQRVADQDIGERDARSTQQGMEIADELGGRARQRHRVAAAGHARRDTVPGRS